MKNILSENIKLTTYDDYNKNGNGKVRSGDHIYTSSILTKLFIALGAVNTLLIFLTLTYTWHIAQKQFPTLVQTTTGEVIKIDFKNPSYRSPEVIKRFVSDTLYYLMTMAGYSNEKGESSLNPDRSLAGSVTVQVNGRQGQITQAAWLASESLEPNFADEFRGKLAEITPRDIFTGEKEIILKIDYVKNPEEILDKRDRWTGQWRVDVIGSLKVYSKRFGDLQTIPFNKRVVVRPINTLPVTDVEMFGELAVALNRISLSGLQITEIKDLALVEAF